jgi:hypothetical protein
VNKFTEVFFWEKVLVKRVPSYIIAFVLAHWQDILIAFSITGFFFLLDLIIHKGHKAGVPFDPVDRLLSYFMASGVFIFAIVWFSDVSTAERDGTLLGFGLFYFLSFIIFLLYCESIKGKKIW